MQARAGQQELAVEPDHAGTDAVAVDDVDDVQVLAEQLRRAQVSEAQVLQDLRNYRRHAEAELAAVRHKAQVELLAELAETLQALERAGSAAATDPAAVREGIALVTRNLRQVFEAHGLQRVPTVGVPFDPTLHEALLVERVAGVSKGIVVRELSPGFRTEAGVVRPAKVSVAA